MARELVYYGQYTISELDWPFQPVLYAGTALAIQTRLGLSASLEVRSAFPWRSGFMQDSDFLNYDYGDLSRTHFSQHDCYTERAITLDARVGWVFHLGSAFTLQPFAAFGLMQYKWTARDGYLQYPPEGAPPYTPWDPAWTKVPVSGTGIIYEQTYLIPAAGLSAGTSFGERFDARLSLGFSPFVFCNDLDNHVQRTAGDTDYYDYLRRGFLLEPCLSLGLRMSPKARLSLEVSYRWIFGLLGDTEVVDAGPGLPPGQVSATYEDGAGAAYNALDVSLAFSFRR
jgi:outer membrane protease